MKDLKKGVLTILSFLIIGFFYILPLVNGADIIQVQNPDQSTQQGSGFWSFIHTAWFKGAIVIIILAIILIVLIVLIGRWLVKYIKTRNDIFYQVRQNRLKLAREQRTYPSKSWFRITRNTPIRLCYKDANGKIKLTRPIAYHRGDYTTHEGNLVISFYMQGHKTFLIIPKIELLVIPNRKEVIVKTKDYKTGKEKEITYSNLPTAKDIVQFNEGEIILYCKSISNLGMFYIPVLEGTKDGKVIDLSMPVYQSLKDVVVEEFLFSQTDEFSKVAKKSIDLNPNLRYDMKRSDPSQSSEIPSSQGK